jgi:hypothetical protein
MIASLTLVTSHSALSRPITVAGWPWADTHANLSSLESPPLTLGDDPATGRLACPPLTRVNLAKGDSDPLILRSLRASSSPSHTWALELRRGIHWWSGPEVSPHDIASFLERELPRLVQYRGMGLWRLPTFTTSVQGDSILIRWSSSPTFGPGVLDNASLWRPQASAWECAGHYRPAKRGPSLTLDPVRRGDGLRPIEFVPANSTQRASLRFRMAAQVTSSDPKSLDTPSCKNDIDLPVFVVLSWNPDSPLASRRELRRVFTEIIPRGEILRAGSAHLGTLVSAPIPRAHPGYASTVAIRDFDLLAASRTLDKLGFKRADPASHRLTPEGKPLRLIIAAPSGSPTLLRKVITDSFAAIGVAVKFVTPEDSTPLDGRLEAVTVPWTLYDPARLFHPASNPPNSWWAKTSSPEMRARLESFSLSLTRQPPDFNPLKRLHATLSEDEMITVLLQQKACVESPNRLPPLQSTDPDWFRTALKSAGL